MIDVIQDQTTAARAVTTHVAPTRIVPVDEAVSQHLSQSYWDWRSLFDRDSLANPLQHPDFVLTELATASFKSCFDAVLVCDEDANGKSMAVLAPKIAKANDVGGIGPNWVLQGLRLAGGRFLTERESPQQQVRLLQAAMRHCSDVGAAFLLIEDLDEASPLFQAVQDRTAHGCRLFTTRDVQPRRYIDFPAIEADYWKAFTSLSLRKHRAKVRKAGNARLDRVTEIDQIPEFLRAAHEISKQSWQSQQFGIRLCNDDAELQRFTSLAQQGMLRSYLWWVEDQPAAFAVCNQHSGCLRYEETAFCSQFRNISAGSTMLHLIIEDLFQHNPPKCVDFGGGDAEYKQHFSNRESRSATIWLVPPTWRAGWTLTWLNACRNVRAGVRSVVKRFGWGTRARQWIRSRGQQLHAGSSGQQSDESPSSEIDA